MNSEHIVNKETCCKKKIAMTFRIIRNITIFLLGLVLIILSVLCYKNTPEFIHSEYSYEDDYIHSLYSSQDFQIAISFYNKTTNEIILLERFEQEQYNLFVFQNFDPFIKYESLQQIDYSPIFSTFEKGFPKECLILPSNIEYFINTSNPFSLLGLAYNLPNENPLLSLKNENIFDKIYFEVYFIFKILIKENKKEYNFLKMNLETLDNFETDKLVSIVLKFYLTVKIVVSSSFIVSNLKEYYELEWDGNKIKTLINQNSLHIDAMFITINATNKKNLIYLYEKEPVSFVVAFFGIFYISLAICYKLFSLCINFFKKTSSVANISESMQELNELELKKIKNDNTVLEKYLAEKNDVGFLLMKYETLSNKYLLHKKEAVFDIKEKNESELTDIFIEKYLKFKNEIPLYIEEQNKESESLIFSFFKTIDLFSVRVTLLKPSEKSRCEIILIIFLVVVCTFFFWFTTVNFYLIRELQYLQSVEINDEKILLDKTNVKFALCFETNDSSDFFGNNPSINISLYINKHEEIIYWPLQSTSIKDIEYIGENNNELINFCYKPVGYPEFEINSISTPIFSFILEPNLHETNDNELFLKALNDANFFLLLPSTTYNPKTKISKSMEKISLDINHFVLSFNNSLEENIYVNIIQYLENEKYNIYESKNKIGYINYDSSFSRNNIYYSNKTKFYKINVCFDTTIKKYIQEKNSILWFFGMFGGFFIILYWFLIPILNIFKSLNQYELLAKELFSKKTNEELFFEEWKLFLLLPNCLYESKEVKKIKRLITFLNNFMSWNFFIKQINKNLFIYSIENNVTFIEYKHLNNDINVVDEKRIASQNSLKSIFEENNSIIREQEIFNIKLKNFKEFSTTKLIKNKFFSNTKEITFKGKNRIGSCFGGILSIAFIIICCVIFSLQIIVYEKSNHLTVEEIFIETNIFPQKVTFDLYNNFSIMIGFITEDNLLTQNIREYIGNVVEIELYETIETRNDTMKNLISEISVCDNNELMKYENISSEINFLTGTFYCFSKKILNLSMFTGEGTKQNLEIKFNFVDISSEEALKFQHTYMLNLYVIVPNLNIESSIQQEILQVHFFPYFLETFNVKKFVISEIEVENELLNFKINSYDLFYLEEAKALLLNSMLNMKITFELSSFKKNYKVTKDNIFLTIGICCSLFYFIFRCLSCMVSRFNRYYLHYLVTKLVYEVEECSECQLLRIQIYSFFIELKSKLLNETPEFCEINKKILKTQEILKLNKLSKNIFELTALINNKKSIHLTDKFILKEQNLNNHETTSMIFNEEE